LPAAIRVNTAFAFPALVQGSGLVTITKANGIWTVGFSVAGLGIISPPANAIPTDYVIAYDAVAGTFFKLPLSFLVSATRVQRLVTGAGGLPIIAGDSIVNLNCSAPLAISVPLAASRAGAPLTFKDVGGQAFANNITLNRTGADTFDGLTSVQLTQNYQGITLVPANDGTTAGWSIE
jgi:hypothetical protein